MMRHRVVPAGLAVLLSAAATIVAQPAALPPGITRVTSVEGITEYKLANGLRALLFPDASKPTIVVNIVYQVGSRHEDYGETGMAHLLEHLVSYGSPRHPDAKKEQAERGAQRNASTWFDRTNYYEVFPASDANLEWALDLEADRMLAAFVRKDILDSQMTVVRNEYEASQNSPQGVLQQQMLAAAFDWHNYGKSTIGAKSDIENVPIERLQAFYRTHYRPDNAVLLVAGQFEEKKALAEIAKRFGPLKNPDVPLPPTYTAEPTQQGERSVVLRRAGDVQQVGMLHRIPAAAHADSSLLSLVAHILTDAPSGRLYKALVEAKKAASVGGGPMRLREPGYMSLGASVRKDQSLDDARDTMAKVVDGISAAPITAEELDRAKADLLKTIELSLTSTDQLGLALTEWTAAGDWRLLFLHRDRLKAATLDEVQRAATTYLKPSNRTIGLFIPEDKPSRAEIPKAPDITALVRDYRGDPTMAAGEVFDPTPRNIEQRAQRSELASGMKLVLLPKKTRGAVVHGYIRLNFGTEAALKGRGTAAELAGQMLMRGTAQHTRQQIQDELSRLKCDMSVFGGAAGATVTWRTVAANVPAVMRLAVEVLRSPTFPADELELLRTTALAGLENSLKSPETLARIALSKHLSPYPADDVRHVKMPAEEIPDVKAARLEDVKKFHADFYGASNGELSAVGDFEVDEVKRLAAELFGGWKSPAPYAEVRRAYQTIAPDRKAIETPEKANAMFTAGLLANVSDEHADYPALVLANYMLGGHSASRLYLRIRGKEGLSYGVGASLTASPKEPRAQWSTFAITNPVNIDKVEEAFRDELARTLEEGFKAEEVASAKSGWSQGRRVQRSSDAGLAGRLAQHRHEGRTMAWDAELEEKVGALTPEACTAALRRHVDPAQLSFVRAGDFAKK
jgi:zinc protease